MDRNAAVACALRGALEESRALLVVDDVAIGDGWAHGEQFRILRACVPRAGESRLLVTTRDMEEWAVAAQKGAAGGEKVGAVDHSLLLRKLEMGDALRLLRRTAGLRGGAVAGGNELEALAKATGRGVVGQRRCTHPEEFRVLLKKLFEDQPTALLQ